MQLLKARSKPRATQSSERQRAITEMVRNQQRREHYELKRAQLDNQPTP